MKILISAAEALKHPCHQVKGYKVYESVEHMARVVHSISGVSCSGARNRFNQNPEISWEDMLKPARSKPDISKIKKSKAQKKQELHDLMAEMDERKRQMGLTV